ncbi:LysR family transcriptional regulator [Agrobacterium sp. rho-13.3]|uniref:LysR family transcriptional regulator n=1 Tax=Agrobacterium sp. rho-13.3 TaxID=3072980 RepID=UPI002A0F87EA|nr:LysR family transcriptional regulator [Agrobacterium sp. rho-13.3]MDX8306223.1 LysR family transcriptional regulator [Agrobacterium sp. rho-13.3]MDX8307446.1 LysR family transcriptional regulator [Agrobacterium sp. rho-13.3]
MTRQTVDDLIAFMVVAREQSFTRAAAQMGISQPALSKTIRELEHRLGVRLLTRTTRSVSTTEAGERLLQTIGPHFDGIEAGLAALGELRDRPSGNLRITSVEHASQTILAPALAKLLPEYPEINVEIINDYSLTDIVADRFDMGIRLGEQVAQDMIAVRIGPDFGMAVVGSPTYFCNRPAPITPHDLTSHACIGLRLPTSGGLWSWPFAKDGRELKVRPQGPAAFNTIGLALDMALADVGLAYLPEDVVGEHIASGHLIRVLVDWSPPASGYHLYYPSRRQPTPAFSLILDTLRYRG